MQEILMNTPIRKQNPYQHHFVNVNNNNYTCCAKMVGKEETPKCRRLLYILVEFNANNYIYFIS
jgi:hypothetical protein